MYVFRYGKQVQAEVMKERSQAKKKSLEEVKQWRKERGGQRQGAGGVDDDGFDVQMDTTTKRSRSASR
jgi:hypothetical protein